MPPLTVSSCRDGHRVRPNAERKRRTPERDGSVSAPADASRAVPGGAAFPGSGGSCSPSLVSVTAPRRAAAGVGALGQPPGSSRSIGEELGIWEMRCAAQGLLWLVPARQTLRLLQGGSGKSRLGRAPPGGAGAAHPAGFGRGPARGAREHRASITDASGTTADEPQTPEAPRVLSPGVVAALLPPATCPPLCGAPSLQLPKKPRNPPARWGGGDGDGAGHEARILAIRTRGRGSRVTARRAGGDQDSSRASFLFPFGSAFCLFPLPPGLTQGHAPSFSPHAVTAPCCGHVRTLRPSVPALRGPALSHILATSLQLPPFKDTIPLIIPRATPTPSPGGLT